LLPLRDTIQSLHELRELLDLARSESDDSLEEDLWKEYRKTEDRFTALEEKLLLSGEHDDRPAILSIHPGAGGTESCDWAEMLLRMYIRWTEDQGFKCEVTDVLPGEEAGIKSATVMIRGENAYGLLKGEKGVHRLVRISPYDSNKRRHTSFASVSIIPEVEDEVHVDIRDDDLRIDTYRSSGCGGQHLNVTDSAVRIVHIPTGIVVQCQNERSQTQNKVTAMKILRARLYEMKLAEQEAELLAITGPKKSTEWGNQIRSYVFQPYTMVKDHRTQVETSDIHKVIDGYLEPFLRSELRWLQKGAFILEDCQR